jgi:hypothetical protein
MALSDLYTILSAAYPTAYWSFPEGEAPAMPYLVYFEASSDNFGADNKVYHHRKVISVELLTKTKDVSAEQAVEAKLDANDIYWEKTETHLDDEDAYEVIYTLEV